MRKNDSLPSVSVVIPFRNAADTLPECLDSLQNQTLGDYEALLIDDGSDDEGARLVLERARRDPRLRLLRPGRFGLVNALNLGVSSSRAELIARMDADDIMHEDRLRLQRSFLCANPGVAVVGCRVALFPEDGVAGGYREYVRWLNRCIEPSDISSNLYFESPLAHPSVMFRRRAFDAVGGYRGGTFPEDYDLWLRVHKAGFRMAKLPEVLLSWRERPDRTSRIDPRYSEAAFDRLRASHLACDARLHSGRQVVVWGGGRQTRHRVRLLLDHGARIYGWIDVHPRRIGMSVWGLRVHPPEWLNRSPRPFVLAYVRNHGALDKIRDALETWGYREGSDYLPVG